ncbi:kynurenine 3-monooxygenase [Solenopsis invicta]|uniref:kynurenine 3-monooxygenase n=1 Tax=Solenopsis invicta TaxID=13686 RepID=UPI00193DAD0F|nr:kynurenine 3-monooxygenase [Solenopsis invicta]
MPYLIRVTPPLITGYPVYIYICIYRYIYRYEDSLLVQLISSFGTQRNEDMVEVERKSRIVIVGGGLVGGLAACFFAKRGHRVMIYEYRSDVRREKSHGQSINLALSFRGREALKTINLEDTLVKRYGTRMRGRMLHDKNGNLKEVIYDKVKENCIYSINRRYLNMVLLDAAEKYPEVELNFNRKLVDADLEKGKMKFLNTNTGAIEDVKADLIIGADGAHSKVRKIMANRSLFNCSQTYIEHGYVEFSLPRRENGEFAMSRNNLHIWPRGEFMMTSLPNEDGTFTGNLFAPFRVYEKLKTREALLNFCTEHFPDFLRLIGEENLVKQFFENEPQTLISIKCKPYHVGKTAVIVGDAAHAMVPFYGQGMNCGFEDILILDELMERYNSDFAKVLPKFSELRCDNGHAICDLAMYNYLEMRDLVTKRSFLLRKFLDNILFTLFPNFWIPLYFSVQFTRMNYRECIARKEWQDKVLKTSLLCIGFLIFAILAVYFIQKAMRI